MAAVPRSCLTEGDKIAIYIFSVMGMKSRELAFRFERSKRYINMIIAQILKKIPDLREAIHTVLRIAAEIREEDEEKKAEQSIIPTDLEEPEERQMTCRLAVMGRTIQRLEAKLKTCRLQRDKAEKRVESLKACLQSVQCNAREGTQLEVPGALDPILRQMVDLSPLSKYQRRYSDDFYRFCYIFSTLSPRAYRYARKHLILPTISSLGHRFGDTVRKMKRSLTQLDSVHEMLEAFLAARNPSCGRIVATIGVDAFAFRLFLRQLAPLTKIRDQLPKHQLTSLAPLLEDKDILEAISELEEDEPEEECMEVDAPESRIESLFEMYNNSFIYVLLPLDKEWPTLTLHLAPAKSGVAKYEHIEKLRELITICSCYNIDAHFMSVDGDGGWNCLFREMFDVFSQHWKTPFRDLAFNTYTHCSQNGIQMAVGDLLHLLKRARARYIDHEIHVFLGDEAAKTNYQNACEILDAGPALYDKSQLGKMRDFYPIQLFTIENVLILLADQSFPDAYYFLAFTLLLLVIRVPFFQMDFRLKLLEASFLMFQKVYNDIVNTPRKPETRRPNTTSSQGDSPQARQKSTSSSNLVTFAETTTLQKILSTVISYCAGFQLFPDRLRTDSLGTHIVEQKIGQARQGMDNRWSRILSNISQSLLRSIMLSSEGLQIGSSGRLKACGCCLDGSADMTISDFDPVLLSRVMWHSLGEPGRATDCFAPSFERVARWLTIIAQTLEKRGSEIGKIWAPNPTTNSGILSRLINSNLPAYPAHRDQ